LSNAAERGWPIRSLSGSDLVLICTPNPTPAQIAAGVLKVAGLPGRVAKEVAGPFRELVAGLIDIRKRHGLAPLTCAGGNNFRAVRGYEDEFKATGDPDFLSNHAFGLAMDFNVGTNPMGKPIRSDFPRDEVYALCKRVGLSWGREWSRPDPMHFEWLGTRTEALNWSGDDLSAAAEQKINEIHDELFKRHKNRTGDPEADGVDTMAGYAINADGYGYRAQRELAALRAENAVLRELIGSLPRATADELLNRKISATKWNGGNIITEDATVYQLLSRGSEGSIAAHIAQGEPFTKGTENV